MSKRTITSFLATAAFIAAAAPAIAQVNLGGNLGANVNGAAHSGSVGAGLNTGASANVGIGGSGSGSAHTFGTESSNNGTSTNGMFRTRENVSTDIDTRTNADLTGTRNRTTIQGNDSATGTTRTATGTSRNGVGMGTTSRAGVGLSTQSRSGVGLGTSSGQ